MKRLLLIILAFVSLNVSAQYVIKRPIPGRVAYPAVGAVTLPGTNVSENQTYNATTATLTNGPSGTMRSRWPVFITNGNSGYFQARSTGSIGIVLSSTAGSFESNPTYFVSKNTANGKVEAVVNGSSYYTLNFDYTSFVYLRITVTPTQIRFQYSNDDVTYGNDQLITRVESGDLYVKTYYGSNGDTLTELKTFGFN